MEKIIIKPEGAFYSFFNEETDSWIEKDLIESSLPISWYMEMPVEINGRVSILKILELFERYEEQLDFMYARALKTLCMDDIFNIIDQITDFDKSSLKATCLVWVGELIDLKDGEEPLIPINSALIGLDTEDLEEDSDDDQVYQLTNFDFVEWVKMPLYLDNFLDFVERGQEDVLLSGEYQWTLHNIFDTILSEISLNLFVSGLVSNPDVVVNEQHARLNVTEFFNYLDGLDNIEGLM